MTNHVARASVLGLPAELRLKIYEHAILTDIHCTIVDNIEHVRGSVKGTQALLRHNRNTCLALHIPWLNLQLSCKIIAFELRSFMSSDGFSGDERNTAYILDLDVYNCQPAVQRRLVWRSMPCAPSRAQKLIISVNTRHGCGPWTEGGTASLARALFQTLNHLLHCGPLMLPSKPLRQHMHIHDLIVDIDVGKVCKSPASGWSGQPMGAFGMLNGPLGAIEKIAETGFLHNYVGEIRVRRGVEETFHLVRKKDHPGVIPPWRRYGFDWGLEYLQSVERSRLAD